LIIDRSLCFGRNEIPADLTDKSAGIILFRLRVLLENNGSHQPESSIAEFGHGQVPVVEWLHGLPV
jgi:hypothetical protein